MKLQGEYISLRAIEPSDIDSLYQWENNTETWTVSSTQAPFSRFVLEQYIASAHQDIYTAKQLRLMIDISISSQEGIDNLTIGCIDLFDFDPNHQRAGIGVLIADTSDRQKGYASEALQILTEYCFHTLNLHQLYCNITADNEASIILFQKQGFQITGIKKQWVREGGKFKDELLLQKIR
ncbi:MAG: GNAT family N-acetyltransferase [Bacteroidota bacterium]